VRGAPIGERYSEAEDLRLLQWVARHGTSGAQGESYWQKAVNRGFNDQGQRGAGGHEPATPPPPPGGVAAAGHALQGRTAASLRERWRKVSQIRARLGHVRRRGDAVPAIPSRTRLSVDLSVCAICLSAALSTNYQ
jgi:hypothetical protein